MDAEGFLAECARRVDARLTRELAGVQAPPALLAAMRHLIFPGGKRLRPAVVFAACRAAGGPLDAALGSAAAVELIHTYSLIHDDLPCMDDDQLRRGRPTVHIAHGEALAVLAGDALQALAFETLARSESASGPGLGGVGELARAAGASQLVGGQADDLAFAGAADRVTLAREIASIHRRKTAALFATSAALGARSAGAPRDLRERLARAGEAMGMAFQIADDCLDRNRAEACSVLRVHGPEEALAHAAENVEGALEELRSLGEAAEPFRQLARFAVRRDR
ncbi:MAG: polyprenyl synthetase family protein [Myxococcales bacterium]|nr:polyprenyl synthetase family protein [Myxococcales bacterium]